MWLDNYYKICYLRAASTTLPSTDYAVDISNSPIRSTSGSEILYANLSYSDSMPAIFTGFPSITIQSQTYTSGWDNYSYRPLLVVGSGTTPVSASDYCLESEITTLTHSIVTKVHDSSEGTVTYSRTMVNTASESISVSEIGLVGWVHSRSSITNKYSTWTPVLGYREVLETPIVVPAGDTFTVTITHKFTMPA